jgi:catechol 2,3-dioxygenase-like lactoylglutathione lyase family enzyme
VPFPDEVARLDSLSERVERWLHHPDLTTVLGHFVVARDVERSRRFYTEILGGRSLNDGEPAYVALANSFIIIDAGGDPTEDKPTVVLEPPPSQDRVSSFLIIRVADIHAIYTEWSARGARFLTEPVTFRDGIRCHLRDPDGHLIEVGQSTRA